MAGVPAKKKIVRPSLNVPQHWIEHAEQVAS